MNGCEKYMELLSAYTDGELTSDERTLVEEHIISCDACAALLEMYCEVSVSVDNSAAPVPDELLTRVMNVVKSEPSPVKIKKKNNLRIMLIRYMPVAACLAVGLLVWSLWRPLNMQYNENASFNSSGGMSYVAEQAAPAEAPAYTDDSMPMPMPAPEAAPEDGVSGSLNDIGAAPGAADASGDLGTTNDADTTDPAGGESERASQEPASSADLTSEQDNFGTFSDPNETEVREMPWELVENITLRPQEEAFITDVLSNASQWIVVTGELPQYLAERELVNLGPQFGWEIIAEISNDDVQALLAELEGSDTYKTAANMNFTTMANSANLSAPNAVVLYSPEP